MGVLTEYLTSSNNYLNLKPNSMKQITLLTLITICLFSSCTKSSAPTDTVDEATLSAVMSSKDNSQLVIAYRLLKPAEKLELWSRHIGYFIKSHDLTSEQSAFVTDFKNQWLVKNLFEESSPLLNNFTRALPQIKYKAQSLLGVPDAFSFLIDLPSDRVYYGYKAATIHSANTGIRVNSEPGGGDCHCSQTDPYCNTGTCSDNGCTTGSGCGTLWLYKCNGVCTLL